MRRIRNWVVAAVVALGLINPVTKQATAKAVLVKRQKVALYVPGTVHGDVPALNKQAEWTAKALAFLSQLFQGACSTSGQGAWMSAAGLVIEPVNIVASFCTPASLQLHREAIREFAQAMKKDMTQEKVSVEWNGALELI